MMSNLLNCSALLSRCKVVVLEKLSADSVFAILRRAAEGRGIAIGELDQATGNGSLIEEEALKYLSGICDGDARMALNCLQVIKPSPLPSLCTFFTTDKNLRLQWILHRKIKW